MLGVTHYRGDQAEETQYRLRWPEPGGIRILLETGLLAHVVLVSMPMLIEQIAVMNPAIVPEPFTTILHGVLWVGIGAVLVWLLRSESLVSTHRFGERAALTEHLERDRLDRRRLLLHASAATIGAIGCVTSYERFIATVLNLADLLIIVVEEFELVITVTDVLFSVVFLVGFVLFAYGVDRLLIEGLRWTIRQQYESY